MQRSHGAIGRASRMGASSLLAASGFGLTLVWCMLTGHTPGFTSSTLGMEALFNPRMFYLLGIFLLAVAFIAAPRALKRADGALRYVMPLLASFGTACYGLAYRQTFFDPAALAVGGLFVVGVSFFWFLARYVLLLARTQEFSCVVWSVAVALVFKLPVVTAFNLLVNPEWQVVAAIALPVVSALVFEAACAAARGDADADGEGGRGGARTAYGVPVKPRAAAPTSRTFRRNVLILMAVSAILLAVIRSVSDLGIWGGANAGASLAQALLSYFVAPAILLVAFARFALIRMADLTISMRFQPAMLLVMAGLFVVALQASPDSDALPFLADVIQVDELCAHLLFWTVTATALDALDMPSYRVIGLSEAVFAGSSIAWMLLIGPTPIVNSIYVLLATYVTVIAAMYVTWLGGKRRADAADGAAAVVRAPAGAASAADAAAACAGSAAPLSETVAGTCLAIAERFRLSPRETEVFLLLAQGRTHAFIQDELVLSGSTVKTHVGHIYAKMGVADRQEMMDLIWK